MQVLHFRSVVISRCGKLSKKCPNRLWFEQPKVSMNKLSVGVYSNQYLGKQDVGNPCSAGTNLPRKIPALTKHIFLKRWFHHKINFDLIAKHTVVLFHTAFSIKKRVCNFQVVGGSARPKLLKNVFFSISNQWSDVCLHDRSHFVGSQVVYRLFHLQGFAKSM